MRYLSAKDMENLISPTALIAAIEQGLRDFAAKTAIAPARQHHDFNGNTLLTMPVIGADAFGAKIVSVVPSNTLRGLPLVNGLMMLSDRVTGLPIAVLDAAMLTAQRTGAIGAVGLKWTTPSDVDRVGIIGTGIQGAWQAIFAGAVRGIRTVYFIARSEEKAKRFVDRVSQSAPRVQCVRCADVHELLIKVPVVITATTSSVPVLPAEPGLLENKHFLSIGSFKPSMQELPMTVHRLAGHVVVDSDAAKFEVGDLIEPLSSGLLRDENIIHIADLVVGKRTVDVTRTTLFKSVGMALYDLYVARAFLTEAQRLNRGIRLES